MANEKAEIREDVVAKAKEVIAGGAYSLEALEGSLALEITADRLLKACGVKGSNRQE